MMIRYLISFYVNGFVIAFLLLGVHAIAGGNVEIFGKAAPLDLIAPVFLTAYFLTFKKVPTDESGNWTIEGFRELRTMLAKIGFATGAVIFVFGLMKTLQHVDEPSYKVASILVHSGVALAIGFIYYLSALITRPPQVVSKWTTSENLKLILNGYIGFSVVVTTMLVLGISGSLFHYAFIQKQDPPYKYDAWDSARTLLAAERKAYIAKNCKDMPQELRDKRENELEMQELKKFKKIFENGK